MAEYGYLNARLRGMKTKLFATGEYEKMLKAVGLRGLSEVLGQTRIKPSLEKALIRYQGIDALEEAFKMDFTEACRKVLAISEGEQKKLIGILLQRWDVFNIKTVLRGKHSDVSSKEIVRNLVPAAELDDQALQEMAGQLGVKEVVDLLATWGVPLAEPLVENLEGYFYDRNLVRLELSLDRAYYAGVLKHTWGPFRNRRLVNDLMRSEVDITNIISKIRLVLDDIDTFMETKKEKTARIKKEKRAEREEARAKKAEERNKLARPKVPDIRLKVPQQSPPPPAEKHALPPIQDYFIPGGKEIGGNGLLDLLRCHNMGEVLALLEKTSYGRFVSAEMTELESIPDLGAFERTLEIDLIKRMTRLYRHEPIGMATAISYLWMKYNEFINLRVIGRGKEFNIPENILRSELVYAL